MSVERLPVDRIDDVVDVFAEAFEGYPVMRCTVGPDGDVAARERRLVRLFVTRRVARGGPMYGVTDAGAGSLAGAILLTLPNEPDPPPEVAELSAAAWRDLGEETRLRYDAYTAASNFFSSYGPHLHLNMIGVRRAHKGTGLGGRLLEQVRALAEAEPGYSGVSLTTENPRNVDLYQRFGYEVVGHAPVDTGFETWGMFLRIG
ncbi:MAG TPA: GNAT family N-acetyltransferase [Vicinamibacterales bacterium]|nr:GNAT family N-acetyltransferase [Vicinamibacterales bacterium]